MQRLIFIGQIGLSGATLAFLALRPPARFAQMLERLGARPVLGGAAGGAALSLILAVVGLPLGYWAHERAVDVGLSTQSLGPWLGDQALTAAIGAVFGAIAGAVFLGLVRRYPRRWFVPAAAAVVVIGVVSTYLTPVVIDPLFNKFDPLPKGPLRTEVLRLAKAADVDVGQVYRVDASRRTTAINAYVGGIGHTKRVVIYDNLIEDYPRDQVRSVVAHELGHVHGRDVPRGLLWLALVALPGTFLAQVLAERIAPRELTPRRGARRAGPEALPALALSLALVSFGLTCAGNALSRRVEAHADAYALRLTDDPKAFIELERSLTLRNLGDPDPPAVTQKLLGTHPTTVERIGFGRRWEQEGRRSLSP
ncbi:MAG TPA: M48 family metalloprotease [Thermoleophilaceae bacterium]|nr:M48 family metalloprotease [Thermoleophilaceae bacterium]